MCQYKHQELTRNIINAAYKVHNTLGCGFLEKVYHKALVVELDKRGFSIQSQKPISVKYENQVVGEYFADIVVEDKVIVEVKAVEKINSIFEAQLLNYLKASELKVGLIVNFADLVQIKRMVL